MCVVFRTLSAITVNVYSLYVVCPTVTDISDNQVVVFGNNIAFSCTATGNPLPSILWRKDNSLVDFFFETSIEFSSAVDFFETSIEYSSAVTSTVTLSTVTSQDSGLYTCVAYNELGDVTSKELLLTVHGKEMYFKEISFTLDTYLRTLLELVFNGS